MKKLLLTVILIAGISCSEDTKTSDSLFCTNTGFSFINQEGNDYFLNTDSLDVDDLEIIPIQGRANIFHQNLYDSIYIFSISFIPASNIPHAEVLFQFKNETDTISVDFVEIPNGYYIGQIYYNRELIEDNIGPTSCGTSVNKIVK